MIVGVVSLATWAGVVDGRCGRRTPTACRTAPSWAATESSTSGRSTRSKPATAHPIRAEDYLDFPRVRAIAESIAASPNGGVVISAGNHDFMYVVPPPGVPPEGGAGHTVFFPMLGMASMNTSLDVRVLDNTAWRTRLRRKPIESRTGAIGHRQGSRAGLDRRRRRHGRTAPVDPAVHGRALGGRRPGGTDLPETQDLLASYRSDLTWARFKQNLRRSFEFADYRIDRVPAYEIQRCGLEVPQP